MVEFMDSIDDDFMETIGDNLLGIQTFVMANLSKYKVN